MEATTASAGTHAPGSPRAIPAASAAAGPFRAALGARLLRAGGREGLEEPRNAPPAVNHSTTRPSRGASPSWGHPLEFESDGASGSSRAWVGLSWFWPLVSPGTQLLGQARSWPGIFAWVAI